MYSNPEGEQGPPEGFVITTFGYEAAGAQWGQGTWGTGFNPVANQAYYLPFVVARPFTVYRMAWISGSSAGNVDAGVYSFSGSRLVSTGSTAMAGANAIQQVDVTDTDLVPSRYYLAIAFSSASASPLGNSPGGLAPQWALAGGKQEASAFPLPATATFAVATADKFPVIAAIGRSAAL